MDFSVNVSCLFCWNEHWYVHTWFLIISWGICKCDVCLLLNMHLCTCSGWSFVWKQPNYSIYSHICHISCWKWVSHHCSNYTFVVVNLSYVLSSDWFLASSVTLRLDQNWFAVLFWNGRTLRPRTFPEAVFMQNYLLCRFLWGAVCTKTEK